MDDVGSVKIDVHRRERALASRYNYNELRGVTAMLQSVERLRTLRINGNLDAAIILIDVLDGLRKCGLSPQERQAVQYRYLNGFSQRETALRMGTYEMAVKRHLGAAAAKLARFMRTEVAS